MIDLPWIEPKYWTLRTSFPHPRNLLIALEPVRTHCAGQQPLLGLASRTLDCLAYGRPPLTRAGWEAAAFGHPSFEPTLLPPFFSLFTLPFPLEPPGPQVLDPMHGPGMAVTPMEHGRGGRVTPCTQVMGER